MRVTVEKAKKIAKEFIGKEMLNCVKLGHEYIFQYDVAGFDPFVAVSIKSGAIRHFTPAENPDKYFRKLEINRIF